MTSIGAKIALPNTLAGTECKAASMARKGQPVRAALPRRTGFPKTISEGTTKSCNASLVVNAQRRSRLQNPRKPSSIAAYEPSPRR